MKVADCQSSPASLSLGTREGPFFFCWRAFASICLNPSLPVPSPAIKCTLNRPEAGVDHHTTSLCPAYLAQKGDHPVRGQQTLPQNERRGRTRIL